MTRPEAIQDAEQRMERTGLTWNVIRIKQGWFKRTYETVSEHHQATHQTLYDKGIFKIVDTFIPEEGTEVDLSHYMASLHLNQSNLDRTTRRKLERKLKRGKSFAFKIPNSKDNANLDIPEEIKDKLING